MKIYLCILLSKKNIRYLNSLLNSLENLKKVNYINLNLIFVIENKILFQKNLISKIIKSFSYSIINSNKSNIPSSRNLFLKFLKYKNLNFKIIGSAHNYKEVALKIKQGCSFILLSKLFLVNYDKKAPFLGVIKFNNLKSISKFLIPLGGINSQNLNELKNVYSEGFAILTELKKKPAIIRRLF